MWELMVAGLNDLRAVIPCFINRNAPLTMINLQGLIDVEVVKRVDSINILHRSFYIDAVEFILIS